MYVSLYFQLTAVLLSIGGIVLFASTYGFKGPTVIGIVLTVLAAAASAIYQVSKFFKIPPSNTALIGHIKCSSEDSL